MVTKKLPVRGLVIKEPYVSWILSGEKTWEMRSSHTRVRGEIALIRQGSGLVVGTARLVDSIGPLSDSDMRGSQSFHRMTDESIEDPSKRKWRHAWVLRDAQVFHQPVSYSHPKGAVTWVQLGGGEEASPSVSPAHLLPAQISTRSVEPLADQVPLLNSIESVLSSANYFKVRETKKKSFWVHKLLDAGVFIDKVDAGRDRISVITHPDTPLSSLYGMAGVEIPVPGTFYHSSNMREFPKRMHRGANPIPHGHKIRVENLSSLRAALDAMLVPA